MLGVVDTGPVSEDRAGLRTGRGVYRGGAKHMGAKGFEGVRSAGAKGIGCQSCALYARERG
jgi:hypothetical protein